MGSNREKFNITIAILKKLPFLKGTKNIMHFDGSNDIFVDCKRTQPGYRFISIILEFSTK